MPSNPSLLDRTDSVYRQLRSLRRRFRFGAWLTLIIGGLLLLLVATYFYIGYREISSFRDPDLIVSLVGDTVDQQIPLLRQTGQDQVKTNAPIWAEQASQQLLAAIPPLRQQLETLALQKSDELVAKINTLGEQQFRRVLDQNRATVQDAIDQLKRDENISEGVLIALQQAIEKEFQIDADSQAAALVTVVSDMNANMEKLLAGENLTRQQRAERRALMMAKRFQAERLGDLNVNDLSESLPVLNNLVQEFEEKQLRKEQEEQAQQADAELAEATTGGGQAAEAKAADKPEDAAAPAKEAEPKKETAAEEKKPEEAAKSADKPEAAAKPADKPEAAAKPADKPEAKTQAADEKKPEAAAKPAQAEEKKEAPAEEKKDQG